MEKRTLLLLLVLLASCRDTGTKKIDPVVEPRCGDGLINTPSDGGPPEDCEGSNLGEATCQSLGFDQGQLSCSTQCKYLTSLCSRRCGNGVIDAVEECDGKLGVGACVSFGYNTCTSACKLDLSHCVPVLMQPGAALQAVKGGPAVIGDLEPKGLGDLVMAVPSYGRVETFGYTIEQGFLMGRKLSFQRTPVAVEVADLNGDGRMDVASLNDDGAIDRYLYIGTSFAFQTLPDAGCPASRFLGAATPSDAGASLLAVGCADAGRFGAVVVQRLAEAPLTIALAGETATLGDLDGDGRLDVLLTVGATLQSLLAPAWAPGPSATVPFAPLAIAAGDFDGDGDLDLAALDATGVFLWENTGVGFAPKSSFPAAGAGELKVADLDLDGRPDLLWQLGDKVQFRRNQGSWSFASSEALLGPGAPLSMALGDVDGDGDLDIASTHSAGGDATVTYVLVNKVR